VSAVRHGWILEWFVKDDDSFVDRTDMIDPSVARLQDIFGEPSVDSMMCFSYGVGAEHVEALRYPPPKDPPQFIKGARRMRPVTPAEPAEPPALH
jgi:hypothetical protein